MSGSARSATDRSPPGRVAPQQPGLRSELPEPRRDAPTLGFDPPQQLAPREGPVAPDHLDPDRIVLETAGRG